MNNYYRVLGLDINATDDEIKEAYSRLAEKYGSTGAGNPLSDISTQRMNEINDAYDHIMSERRLNRTSTGQSSSPYGNNTGYLEIRRLINGNQIGEAEAMLNQIPPERRTAEWNYLMGCVSTSKGWLSEATEYYKVAASMEPNNVEYTTAYDNVAYGRRGRAQGNPYTTYSEPTVGSSCSTCDLISGLCCLNMLCRSCCNCSR